jgi:putative protease
MTRQCSWASSNRRHGCGLCAIPRLLALGIHGVKLVGRGAPSAQKLANLRLARDFIALAASGLDFDSYRLQARRAHRQRFGTSCSPNVCYYPEFYLSE